MIVNVGIKFCIIDKENIACRVSFNKQSRMLENFKSENENYLSDYEEAYYHNEKVKYENRIIRYFDEEDYCSFCRDTGILFSNKKIRTYSNLLPKNLSI